MDWLKRFSIAVWIAVQPKKNGQPWHGFGKWNCNKNWTFDFVVCRKNRSRCNGIRPFLVPSGQKRAVDLMRLITVVICGDGESHFSNFDLDKVFFRYRFSIHIPLFSELSIFSSLSVRHFFVIRRMEKASNVLQMYIALRGDKKIGRKTEYPTQNDWKSFLGDEKVICNTDQNRNAHLLRKDWHFDR